MKADGGIRNGGYKPSVPLQIIQEEKKPANLLKQVVSPIGDRKVSVGAANALPVAAAKKESPAVIERGEINNKNFRADKIPGMRPRSNYA